MDYGRKGIRAKQKALNSKGKRWWRKLVLTGVKLLLLACVAAGVWGVSAGMGLYRGILSATPQIRLSDVVAIGEATIVYDCEGNELDQYVSMNSNRIQINDMDQLPDYLGEAFVAIEDERFFQHNGIDFQRIVGAGWIFLKSMGQERQGASTITQQLLKNTVFTTWTEEGDNLIKQVKRKLQEQYLALEISKYYSKEDILLRYMNAINLGQNTLGVESASLRYFGKSASDLTISEAAVIACITQNPYGYNPIRFPEKNARRRKTCLDNMLRLGFISETEYEEAIADTDAVYERIGNHDIDYRENTNTTAGSYFSDAVYEQVKKDLVEVAGYSDSMAETLLTAGGLRIESTLDPSIQAILDQEAANPDNFPDKVRLQLNYALSVFVSEDETKNFSKENMITWFKQNVSSNFNMTFNSEEAAYEAISTYRAAVMQELGIENTEDNYEESITLTIQPQTAIVVEDQHTGYVVAMVGGRGTKEGRRTLNRATNALRSPGSTFKVLSTFVPALDSAGQTLATVYNDAPFNYDDGTPVHNWYTTGYKGIQSIRDAIRQSENIVTVKTLTVITPQLGYDYLINMGFTTLTDGTEKNGQIYSDVRQPLAIGGLTNGVSPYELNAGYAAIANMGNYVTPKLYSRVTDADGNVILDNTNPASRQVMKETTAFLITDAMVDVVTTGTGGGARFNGMSIAGKTGTSSDDHDVWFSGFTPYYTCTVWTGYDTPLDMSSEETGLSKKLWRAVMSRIHENLPNEPFERPQGIVQAQVCSQSGLLPVAGLCDTIPGNIKTEYFAEGTEPVDICNIHYTGEICEYDGLPASADCPFKITGTVSLPLVEDPSLVQGSTIVNPDGTVSIPRTTNYCQHDALFYANPDYEAILNSQRWELEQRHWAAWSGDE